MPRVPDLRLAICRRCRWPERRAAGADDERTLLDHARTACARRGINAHVRISQCLNSCDGGHTVRVELHGAEVALVGIRRIDELDRVLDHLRDIGERRVPPSLRRRVWQVWVDGKLHWHIHRSAPPDEPAGEDPGGESP
ncbi:MAG: hypothetical protein EA398_16785 [Deltaproteobacteria bacterium]|nr:MAG: hypothetical protein EA398_16785 [Deltaproteobacteria bacterium]